jgi:hypothetical protein
LIVPFVVFTLLYLVLGVVVVAMLRAHVFAVGTPTPSMAPKEPRRA